MRLRPEGTPGSRPAVPAFFRLQRHMVDYVIEVLLVSLHLGDARRHIEQRVRRNLLALLWREGVFHHFVQQQRLVDVHRDDAVVPQTDDPLHLSGDERLDRRAAHLGRQHAVAQGGRAAALHMRQPRQPRFNPRFLFDRLAELLAVPRTHPRCV